MSFFISDAHAQAGPQGAGIEFFLMIGVFFLIMYFMIIRPQSKRAKEHKQLVESLSKGDEIITSGGMAGKITSVDDAFVQLEVAPGVDIRMQRQAVTTVMPKGTLKEDKKKGEKAKAKSKDQNKDNDSE